MARRKPPVEEGAPLWVVSYGDMMSLLLTFFIMLASMANYEEVQDRFMAAIQSIRDALGMTGQIGKVVDPSVDYASLLHKLESVIKPQEPKKKGDTDQKGIYGKNFRLRRIRDGLEITIGGPILFEPFSAQITPEGAKSLEQIGQNMRGHRNKIEVWGHAAEEPRPADWTYFDAMDLSYARAKHVADELIRLGADPRTIRVGGVGANEPVERKVYDPSVLDNNRRVEIIVRESLIDDYVGQEPTTRGPVKQPVEQTTTQPAEPYEAAGPFRPPVAVASSPIAR